MDMFSKSYFSSVYSFANEMLASYFPMLNLEDKSILTVGSSLDQAFNALSLGAREVTVIDINPYTKSYYQIKKSLVLNYDKDQLVDRVNEKIKTINEFQFFDSQGHHNRYNIARMNHYLKDEEAYQKLRQSLSQNKIKIIEGNVYELSSYLTDELYDRIILSNILEYLSLTATGEKKEEKLRTSFQQWNNHLNNDGIIQLLYLYCFNKDDVDSDIDFPSKRLYHFIEETLDEKLNISYFDNYSNTDAILTYQKPKQLAKIK